MYRCISGVEPDREHLTKDADSPATAEIEDQA